MIYTTVDSFSGAGGLLLGLQLAGFESLYSFDNDPFSIETQNTNSKYFKHRAKVEDINNLSSGQLLKKIGLKKGELFLFSGGPPCQGFSIQRIGRDKDTRNNLIFKFADQVNGLQPKFFLMENVAGILGKRGSSLFSDLITRFEQSGYRVYDKILNAQDYNVPQRRRRVFVIGVRKDLHYKPFEFPVTTTPDGKRRTVRQAIENLPEPPLDGSDHPSLSLHRRDKLSELNLKRLSSLLEGQGREFLPKDLLADCHKVSASQIGHRNVYGRMRWDDVAPTITARFDSFTRGLFGHPNQNRSISLREGALLQTFPIDFNFFGNKVDIARQIGNAVPIELARAVGKQIIKYYKK